MISFFGAIYISVSNRKPPENSLRCPREKTVQELASILDQERVVNIRGTPASGKTVLARLLFNHYYDRQVPVIYISAWPQKQTDSYKSILVREARDAGYEFVTYATLADANIVIILDEAQMSYGDEGLWLGLIKSQSGRHEGPRIALFTSYGSPTTGPEVILPGSPLASLGPQQRVSITPSIIRYSPKIALFYNRKEFDDVVSRYCQDPSLLKLDDGASDYLFNLTNGHPGAVDGVLNMLQKVCFWDSTHFACIL